MAAKLLLSAYVNLIHSMTTPQQVIFRITKEQYDQLFKRAQKAGMSTNQFAREVVVNFSKNKTLQLKPDAEAIRGQMQGQIEALTAELLQVKQSPPQLASQHHGKSVEEQIQEALEKRELEQLRSERSQWQQQQKEYEEELEELEQQLEDCRKQLSLQEVIQKLGPGLLNGMLKSIPAQTKDKLLNRVSDLLSGALDGTIGLSEPDQQLLDFGRSLQQQFTQEEFEQVAELLARLAQQKPLLVRLLGIAQAAG